MIETLKRAITVINYQGLEDEEDDEPDDSMQDHDEA